jgi:hypothetical protein
VWSINYWVKITCRKNLGPSKNKLDKKRSEDEKEAEKKKFIKKEAKGKRQRAEQEKVREENDMLDAEYKAFTFRMKEEVKRIAISKAPALYTTGREPDLRGATKDFLEVSGLEYDDSHFQLVEEYVKIEKGEGVEIKR